MFEIFSSLFLVIFDAACLPGFAQSRLAYGLYCSLFLAIFPSGVFASGAARPPQYIYMYCHGRHVLHMYCQRAPDVDGSIPNRSGGRRKNPARWKTFLSLYSVATSHELQSYLENFFSDASEEKNFTTFLKTFFLRWYTFVHVCIYTESDNSIPPSPQFNVDW